MDLCSICNSIVRSLPGNKTWGNRLDLSNSSDWPASAGTCQLCELFSEFLPRQRSFQYIIATDFQGCVSELLIRDCQDSKTFRDEIRLAVHAKQGTHLNLYPKLFFNHILKLAIGSPAAVSGNVCTKEPIRNPSGLFNTILDWLRNCLLHHDECMWTMAKKPIDESLTSLPTRVLDIGSINLLDFGSIHSQYVKLLETNGLCGCYCALSHCWGPPDKQPLRTTHETREQHLNGIPFRTLPKTFQDAVIITRAIGMQYLWIDSLCILQDDDADWRAEAERMGSIYENARLTIAASGATDSSEGCYYWRPTKQVEIPYYLGGEEEAGSVWISMLPPSHISPEYGPLRQRAWTLQESLLSRRMVHFMPGGLTWKCKQIVLDERDCENDIGEYFSWTAIVSDYSGRGLTRETDRPIALRGIANEMQKTRHDRYHLGIWTADLPEQLLWSMENTSYHPLESLPGMPSWTWLSKPGQKLFHLPELLRAWHGITPEKIVIEDSDALKIQGSLKRCRVSEHLFDMESLGKLWHDFFSVEFDISSHGARRTLCIQDYDTEAHDILGLASIDDVDDDELFQDLYCLFIISALRHKKDPLYYVASNCSSRSDSNSPCARISQIASNFANPGASSRAIRNRRPD